MARDVGDLLGEEPRIDGVIDRPDAGDAIPGFEVPPRLPGDRRDAIAELDAVLLHSRRDLERALTPLAVVGAVDWAFDGAGHDLAVAMLNGSVVDDAMAQERPILHQAEHRRPS